MIHHIRLCAFCASSLFLITFTSIGKLPASDWPMWRGDAGHSATTSAELPDRLHLEWTRQYAPRATVWDDPLNQDMMPYDRVFEPIVSNGKMFLNFNDSDKIVALDVQDGSEVWSFYADGPIRFSPVAYRDSILFCSDDGYLYSISAADGKLRWRFRGGPSDRKIIGNRRVISTWPARGGVVVADGTAYFAASIWPFMGTFVYALDADTGHVQWLNDGTSAELQNQPHKAPAFAGVAPQGQLAIAGDLLLVPGGRSLPAAFDRHTGELKFFNFGEKGQGGSFVAANASRMFVHTRVRGTMAISLPSGEATKFRVNEPVLDGDRLYVASGESTSRIDAYDANNRVLWHADADGTGDLIKAGQRLYAAGAKSITAITPPTHGNQARVAWSIPVKGTVVRLLAASNQLFAVTLEGQILAFGNGKRGDALADKPKPMEMSDSSKQAARRLLEQTGKTEGYAFWFGVDDAQLLSAVVTQSKLHVVAVDSDANKVDRLRREFDRAGLYGKRVVLSVGTAESFSAPPYVASLIVVGRSVAATLGTSDQLARIYESVRPYGGHLWIQGGGELNEQVSVAKLAKASRKTVGDAILISRNGALPGAADWSHTYGDVANTVKSNDRRVALPLGLLWFGGSSNMDVLPRHGHGPSEQVVQGRLFIEGMTSLNARDVYTGRVLWKREFPDLDTHNVYFDDSYENTPLSTAYNQLHLPGASARGSNYVATPDGVYVVMKNRCLLLDSATGRTVREFVLSSTKDEDPPEWGYIGVYKNWLLAGVGFADYSDRLGYKYKPQKKRGPAFSPDRSASLALWAFDRQSGEVVWKLKSHHSFLHNGIVAGGGRVYLLDKLPKRVEEQIRHRGAANNAAYRILAVDAQSGKPVWSRDKDVFGTWLSYSAEHDLLLQAGAAATDRSPDEVDKGLAVHQAATGEIVWKNLELAYSGPCILHGDTLITNTTSYHESKGAFSLLDGSPITVPDPVTGEAMPWRFIRNYGCNSAVASENLLTFRSGAAGFYDLAHHGGTGNFGGFKSGCTSNLIIADGVLNAPDYTRTCTCGYQNQTSLALVPMKDNEIWTYNLFGQTERAKLVRKIGVNFGAPGDRLADDGTLWINAPADSGVSPRVNVTFDGNPKWFRKHSSRVAGDGLPWVAASGVEDAATISVSLMTQPEKGTAQTIAASGPDGATSLPTRFFTVRLHFLEPDESIKPGDRVFDVTVQGSAALNDVDIAAEAAAPLTPVVKTLKRVEATKTIDIQLKSRTNRPAVLSGVEIVEE